MDSINFAKGYGKVNVNPLEVEDQVPNPNPHPKTHQKRRFVAISALLLLSLLIGLMLGALIHESSTEPPESPSLSSSTNSAESTLGAVCNVTRYPDSCFSSISSLNSPPESDPEAIFKLSLRVSIAELSKLSSSLKDMNPKEAALSDCQGQFEEALSQLNYSVSAMEVGPGEKMLTEEKIRDVQTWISAAVTDQDTCLDGLEEMGSTTVLDEVKKKMQRSKEYTSNALAIAANFNKILHNLHVSLH